MSELPVEWILRQYADAAGAARLAGQKGLLDGLKEYPCRCGTTHSGDYAHEAWLRHNCLHETSLVQIIDDQYMCGACGADFFLNPREASQ